MPPKMAAKHIEVIEVMETYSDDLLEEDDNPTDKSTAKQKSVVIGFVDRERIIKAHLAGKRPKMIAEIMDLPQRRVEVIIRSYAKTGRIRPQGNSSSTPAPPKRKITESQIELLRTWVNEDCSLTGVQLTKKLNDTFGTNLSVPYVQRHLGPFLFSVKRINPAAEVKKDERTLTLRKEYCQIITDLSTMFGDSEIVYVGHIRFRLAIRDRADKDEKFRGRLRMKNISVCVALTRSEVIAYMGQGAPFSKDQFHEFVTTVIEEQRQRGLPNGVLIMDEACAQDDTDLLNELVQTREYTNIFLPPNSPFLNTTEVLFGEFRDLVERASPETNSEEMLVDLILSGTKLMEAMECPRYVQMVMEYVPRCLDLEAIEMVDLYTIYAEACEDEQEMVDVGDGHESYLG